MCPPDSASLFVCSWLFIYLFVYLTTLSANKITDRSIENRAPSEWNVEILMFLNSGARGGVVVKALRYKPACRGFDSRWCHWNLSVT
jgi:hypothetical protein